MLDITKAAAEEKVAAVIEAAPKTEKEAAYVLAKKCELNLGRPPPRCMKSVKRGGVMSNQRGSIRSVKKVDIKHVERGSIKFIQRDSIKPAQVGSTKTASS